MDTSQWPQQEIVVKPMEENNSVIKPINSSSLESCRRVRAQRDEQQVLKYCPRCNSTNTKFCYYNNYSLSQPRYFCKTCRRYWTDGGTLRNIPVGGGSRKNNKRSSSSSSISQSSSASPSSKKLVLENRDSNSTENPKTIQENGQDLNLGFPESTTSNDFKIFSQLIKGPYFDNIANNIKNMQIPNGLTGIQSSMGLNINSSFMPIPMPIGSDHNLNTTFYSSLTTDHQFMKPMASSSFPLDNDQQLGISSTSSGGYNGNNGRILFPFEDLKMQASSNNATEPPTEDSEQQNIIGDGVVVDNSNGFWNGMLGAGGSW